MGAIKSGQGNYEKLAADIKSTRKVSTKAKQRGIECEPLAAASYAQLKGNLVNLVVSPWLAASPEVRYMILQTLWTPGNKVPRCKISFSSKSLKP